MSRIRQVVAIDNVPCTGSTLRAIVELLRSVRDTVTFTLVHDPCGLAVQLAQYDLEEDATPGQPHGLGKACADTDLNTVTSRLGQTSNPERTVVLVRNTDGLLGVSLVGSDRLDSLIPPSAHYISMVSPSAAGVGLRPGDRVVAIDDVACSGRTLADVVAQLQHTGAQTVLRVVHDPAGLDTHATPDKTDAVVHTGDSADDSPTGADSTVPPGVMYARVAAGGGGMRNRTVSPTPPPMEAPGLSVAPTAGTTAIPRTVTITRTGSGSFGLSVIGPNKILGSAAHDAHYVASVSEGAAAAGLRVGDKVLRIDGTTCAGLLRSDMVARVGACGARAMLEVVHDPAGMATQLAEFVEDPRESSTAPPTATASVTPTSRSVLLTRDREGVLGLSVVGPEHVCGDPQRDVHFITDVSPSAALSGLQAGDRLDAVDGVVCCGRSHTAVEMQLRAVKEHTVLAVTSDVAGMHARASGVLSGKAPPTHAASIVPGAVLDPPSHMPPSYTHVTTDAPLTTTNVAPAVSGTAVTATVTADLAPAVGEDSIGRMSPTRQGYVRRVLLVRDPTSGSFGITMVGPNEHIGVTAHDAHFVSSVTGTAAGAGLRVGDRVLAVNGTPCEGRLLQDAVAMLVACGSLATVEVVHDPKGMAAQAAGFQAHATAGDNSAGAGADPSPTGTPPLCGADNACTTAVASQGGRDVANEHHSVSSDGGGDVAAVGLDAEVSPETPASAPALAAVPSEASGDVADDRHGVPLEADDDVADERGRTVTVTRVDGVLGITVTGTCNPQPVSQPMGVWAVCYGCVVLSHHRVVMYDAVTV